MVALAALLPCPPLTWAFDFIPGTAQDQVYVRWLDENDRVRRAHLSVSMDDGDLILSRGMLDDTTFAELLEDVAAYYSDGCAPRWNVARASAVSL